MKNAIKALIICAIVLLGLWLIIHRRVIAAWLTGSEMPEPPAWHKKYFKCIKWADDEE